MKSHRALAAVPLAALALMGAAACGGSDDDDNDSAAATTATATTAAPAAASKQIKSDPANAKTTITIGSKNFTEQKILGEVYAQALEAAGYTVKKQLNLGDEKTALKALKSGDISAYPEYTGTALLSFFDVPTDKLPKDPIKAYQEVGQDFAKQGIAALPPTPFTSSNEVALTPEKAKELGVTKISDLADKAKDLTLYGTPECRQRLDCLLGLKEVYGLTFKKFVPVDPSLRHTVLEKGQADVSIVFTTDPENQRDKLVLLQDDKGMFPPYNSTLLIKQTTIEKAGPQLAQTIANVNAGLTDEAVQELNARVDLDKETPAEAAGQYLKDSGYTAGS